MVKRRRKRSSIEKAIRTQVAIPIVVPIPYMIAAGTPSLGGAAMTGALRTMQPVPGMMGMIPTVQISKGLLGSMSELEKVGKKRKRKK